MILTGGGALLKGLDKRLEERTSLKVMSRRTPHNRRPWSGKALEELERYRKVFIS